MSTLTKSWLYIQLATIFGKEYVTTSLGEKQQSNSYVTYPIITEVGVVGWLNVHKSKLSEGNEQLIQLLVEQQIFHLEGLVDTEESLWQKVIKEDMSQWLDKWNQMQYSTSQKFHIVYFHFKNLDDIETQFAMKETILAFSEQRSFLIQLTETISAWIIPTERQVEKEIVSTVTEIVNTLTAEFFLNIQVYIGEQFSMPKNLKTQLAKELQFLSLAEKYQVRVPVLTFNNLVPFLYIDHCPQHLAKEVICNLLENVKDDSGLLHTIDLFLKENLNVTEAAKKLYIHRNSMQYRLEKFVEKTGIDIRQFENAVSVYLALHSLGMSHKK